MGLLNRAAQRMLRNGALFDDQVRIGLNQNTGRQILQESDPLVLGGGLSPEGRAAMDQAAAMFDQSSPKIAAAIRAARSDAELEDLLGRLYQAGPNTPRGANMPRPDISPYAARNPYSPYVR